MGSAYHGAPILDFLMRCYSWFRQGRGSLGGHPADRAVRRPRSDLRPLPDQSRKRPPRSLLVPIRALLGTKVHGRREEIEGIRLLARSTMFSLPDWLVFVYL
jgi:hypothetical protein